MSYTSISRPLRLWSRPDMRVLCMAITNQPISHRRAGSFDPYWARKGKSPRGLTSQELASGNGLRVEAEKSLPLRESIHQYEVDENPRKGWSWHCVVPD